MDMQNKQLFLTLALLLSLFACKKDPGTAWAAFTKCGSNACVQEAIAVKDALLSSPQAMLAQFHQTYEKGEDHTIGWLQILADSVLLNGNAAKLDDRLAMQQALIDAVKPFQKDTAIGETARVVLKAIAAVDVVADEDGPEKGFHETLTGIYAYVLPGDAGNGELQVRQTTGDRFKFHLIVVGAAPAHNQGVLEGEAVMVSRGVFEYNTQEFGGKCTLRFIWKPGGMEIRTLVGDPAACGFGNGVRADGKYPRNSFTDPFLSDAELASVSALVGNWQSASDASITLQIGDDGRYRELKDGKEILSLPYAYFPQCPQDCGPVAAMPCLKVMGQDDVCHTIVKIDGQNLELSQIGGTGNTNRYTKI
jgi:hypothetical protein